MFEKASKRMEKFTKDHREEYQQFKGKQTKGGEGGHGQVTHFMNVTGTVIFIQVPVLPAFDSVPSRPSLAKPQRRHKELSDFNKITSRNNRPLPPIFKP